MADTPLPKGLALESIRSLGGGGLFFIDSDSDRNDRVVWFREELEPSNLETEESLCLVQLLDRGEFLWHPSGDIWYQA